MRILAVDPGPTTGFCIYDSEASHCRHRGMIYVWLEEIAAYEGSHEHLYNVLETTSFDVLLVEKFEFRKDDQKRNKIDYRVAEYVGVCKLWVQQNPYVKLVMQGSSLIGKTAFWSDDNSKVKQLGLYNSKAAPHGMDAMRHLLYYLAFTLNEKVWFERLKG